MQQGNLRCSLLGLLAAFGLVVTTATSTAAPDKPVTARFKSVDQVELRGLFYPSDKKTEAPSVILLHEIGGNSDKAFESLALKLQDKGFSVLTFDFRGHGGSKNVQPEFWQNLINQRSVKGYHPTMPADKIDYRTFDKRYFPNLVNDIAAAKAYLDNRNNAGQCNSANTILVGAGDGATLGALWLKEERSRFRFLQRFGSPQFDKTSEARDILATVWISISPKIGGIAVNPSRLLIPGKERKTPMAFVYAEKDRSGKRIAEAALRFLNPKKVEKLHIGRKVIKGAEDLKGRKLLQAKAEAIESFVVEWLKEVEEDKSTSTHDNRDFRNQIYFWIIPGSKPSVAKHKGDKAIAFIPVQSFLSR